MGPVGMRSPVPQEHDCGLPAMRQCVKIVDILGEAAPMEKCDCVSSKKAGACRGGTAGPAWEGDMMWYQRLSGLAHAWLGKAGAWTTLCWTGQGRLRHIGMAVEGSVLLNNLVRSGGLAQHRKEEDPPRLFHCTDRC